MSTVPDVRHAPDVPDASASAELRLVRVQAASGAAFSVFLTLHLVNVMLAALGPDVFDGVQQVARKGYQAAPIEIALVVGPLLVHVAASLLRVRRRWASGRRPAKGWPARLHRYSAVVLLVFFAGHVLATRGASLVYGVWPGFSGIAFTLRWVPEYFWPYYATFSVAALYHAVHGLGVALPVLGVKASVLRRPRVLVPVSVVGGSLLLLGLLGFGGVLFDVGRPEESGYAQLLVRLGFASPPAPPASTVP